MSSILNLNDTTPAAASGFQLSKWQRASTPAGTDPTTGLPYYDVSTEVPNTGGVSVKTADYTLAAGDCGKLVVLNSASAHTFTLPATPPSVGTSQWQVAVSSEGAGALTLAVTSPTLLDGAATSITLAANTGLIILTDGTNYYTQRGAAVPGITQLTGDVIAGPGSGIQASSVVKVNGAVVPTSQAYVGTNSSGQLIAKTVIRKVVLSFPSPATGAVKAFVQVDFAGTIVGWAAFGDGSSGSLSVDVWKKAGTPPPTATAPSIPTVTDKISASAPVAIASALSAASGTSGVSTWTTAVAAGDSITFSVASVTTFTSITVELYIQQTS